MLPGYRLLDVIAARPRSIITRAIREADGTLVVLKGARRPEDAELLRQEFAITRSLPGAHTVRPMALELGPDGPVLVSLDVGGESLQAYCRNRFTLPNFLRLALQMVEAVAEVHAARIVHKDITPLNFCLDARGQSVVLADFSIAERLPEGVDELPRKLTPGGMLAYVSPEQTGRTEQLVDYRTDYYSLGVTFYELLAGQVPFDSSDPLEIVHGHLAKDPPSLPKDVPDFLAAIVRKLLAKSPDERYQSAAGLRRDLAMFREYIEGRATLAELAIGSYDVPERFRIPARLYGRDREVRALCTAFEKITRADAGASLVLVTGYSGIGKSSLIHELRRPLVRARGRFASGKFDQLRRDIPYATLAQALDDLALQLLGDHDTSFDSLRNNLRNALGPNARLVLDLSPRLGPLLGTHPAPAELPPADAKARLHAVLARFFATIAQPDHPLVLFFDDLQWADPASLLVLRALVSAPNVKHLLIVGAYRDNEVSPSHPLMRTLADIESDGGRIEEIALAGLPESFLEDLVADMFSIRGEEAQGLARLLSEKTHGNPFFALRFLREIHRDGLLVFDAMKAQWQWDITAIRARKYAENVVELLMGHMDRLAENARRALAMAACLGNVVTTQDLSIALQRSEEEIIEDLAVAARDHLVLRVANGYEFAHDRVQQAAYERIAEVDRPQVHRELGWKLLNGTDPSEIEAHIFDIVSQLGRGLSAMTSWGEKQQLAELELQAGRRARRSCAFRTASTCLSIGIDALGVNAWDAAPTTMRELCILKAECDFLSSEFSAAEALCCELMSRVPNGPEKATIHRTMIGVYTATGRPVDAVHCGLDALRGLGIDLAERPTPHEVAQSLGGVIKALESRPLETLAELPQMVDPVKRAAVSILLDICPPAVFIDKGLYSMVVALMSELTLTYGTTDESAAAFGYLGIILVDRSVGQYRLGWLAGKLGWDLVERRNLLALRTKLGLLFGNMANSYGGHYHENRRYLMEGLQAGQENGDLIFSCYTCNHLLSNMLICGDSLDEVFRESRRLKDSVERARDQNIIDIVLFQLRLIASLRGETASVGSFDGPDFDEEAFEARIAKSQMALVPCWYYVRKTEARVFGGRFDEAVSATERAEELLWSFTCEGELVEHLFFGAIAFAGIWETASDEKRQKIRRVVAENHRQFDVWAEYCPENFECRRDLVGAEWARIDGRQTDAEHLYEKAIAAARKHRFVHVESLAAELAARFYRQRQLFIPAVAYLRAARDAYARWGAVGKLRALEQQFADLPLTQGTSSEHGSGSLDTSTADRNLHTTLDMAAVLRATRSISEELVLDKLVSTVLRVLLADAGAERGHLVLLFQGEPVLVASSFGDAPEMPRMTHVPLDHCDDVLPTSLARLALRTGEAVIVHDAREDTRCAADRYILRHHPRALASLPIVNQGKLLGLVVLEHRRLAAVFSPERLELIRILAAQASVSLDNALLYAELDRRVRERTRELEDAQRRLVDIAHRAGMAEIATNVLHNVGNALNSVSVSADVVLSRLQRSRIGTVERVAQLLHDHKSDLSGFFATDARSRALPDLLGSLSKHLTDERRANVEELERIYKHLGHIRDIVSLQQSFARAPRLVDNVAINEIIDDAIRISAILETHPGIVLRREIDMAEAHWPLEKHRVLEVLVNLISNAGHALSAVEEHRPRELVVYASVENAERLRLVVRDTGGGISPEAMPHLFTFGFTTRAGGHGFGLHSCAVAVKSMGGEIMVHSDGVNQGATFTLVLPRGRSNHA